MVRPSRRGKVLPLTDIQSSSGVVDGDDIEWPTSGYTPTTELDDLADVNAPTPADGDALTWDDGAGEWVAGSPTVEELDDVGDVNAPTPSDGDVLTWDATPGEWVAAVPTGAADILDIPTVETDDTLVLAPDGLGGVEFRAEAGGGGGGLTQAYEGTNAIGASWETCTVNAQYFAKQITIANACVIESIGCYIRAAAGTVKGPGAGLYDNNSGSPGKFMGGFAAGSLLSTANVGRWVDMACGIPVAPGTYWLVVRLTDTGGGQLCQIAYDAGSDKKTTTTGTDNAFPDGVGTLSSPSRNYSIRAFTIR